MPRIKAPSNLPELVKSTFTRARSDGDLHYFPTQVAILNVDSIPFQLRFSPSLANKPKPPPKDLTKPQKPFDPFENPLPALKVTDLGPSHYLVLNKFAVVPEHFILATTEFKPQTHVLEESDLEATLACIEAYETSRRTQAEQGHRDGTLGGGDGLFAFFNCGDHSGASQPHRHIQLLPIARMKDGFEADTPWSVLADELKTKIAPFATFAEDIKLGMSGAELHSTYLRLYRKACRAVAVYTKDPLHTEEAPAEGPTRISYNMAMTKDTLVVCPRLAEGVKLQSQDGDIFGTVALNGTLLAGTALVKNELEWETLKKDPETLRNVLRDIGVPTTFDNGGELRLCSEKDEPFRLGQSSTEPICWRSRQALTASPRHRDSGRYGGERENRRTGSNMESIGGPTGSGSASSAVDESPAKKKIEDWRGLEPAKLPEGNAYMTQLSGMSAPQQIWVVS
ncbi:hypothetical protein FPRO05_11517 [Fusarium proliferatum]|uniref:Uncharacterized protein n=1 Tax=Gibberella intermedia TaxID=948311 RepID=A0A365NAT5_GIBIN|nr:hypothetical protein FPRO05_11517 [Fusarium proliferatum]